MLRRLIDMSSKRQEPAHVWARKFLSKRLGVEERWTDIVATVVVLKENAERDDEVKVNVK